MTNKSFSRNAASATYTGGGQGTSVTYSATAKILVANPQVFLWKQVAPTVVGSAGGLVTYTLCFSNGGANTAFNVTIVDRWPNNAYWVDCTAVNYSAWVGGGATITGTWTTAVPGVNASALCPPSGYAGPATGMFFEWVVSPMGIGYSGCITFTLSLGG